MLLAMNDVVKQFGGLTAVSNMSFHVDEGEIYGVIGPNGAGKTTIFNLITDVYKRQVPGTRETPVSCTRTS